MSLKHFISLAAAAAVVALLGSCSSSEITHFAVMDMTWAEFYSGEIGSTVQQLEADGYDAVTSATMTKSKRFSGSAVSEDGSTISGVKSVAVGMTKSTFKHLPEALKSRLTMLSDTTVFAYKTLDKDGNFGPYNAPTLQAEDVKARVSSGTSSTWGNYTISLSGLKLSGQYHGVVLTADDGSKYGLKTLDNIWLNSSELGICVAEFTEPHGNKPSFRHTASLEGKTITNITYIMSGAESVSIETDIYLKRLCDGKITIENQKAGRKLSIPVQGVPEGYRLASIRTGMGRQMTTLDPLTYSYSDGKINFSGRVSSGSYRVTFESEEYTDLGTAFEVK